MGAHSDSDLDDGWAESPAPKSPPAHDQTTHGFYVEPPVPRAEDHGTASISDHDRTTIDPVVVLRGEGGTTPREQEHKLVQPERSPLAYVMGDEAPSAVPRAGRSNDSSRFVMALIGDAPPPTVQSEVPLIPTMHPALRRARLIRQWSAVAAVVVVGAVIAIKLATSSHAPRAAAPEATVATAPVAPAPAPAPPTVVPEPPTPGSAAEPEPVAEPAPPDPPPPVVVASAKPMEAPARPSKKPAKAKHKSTAMAKKASAAKKPSKKVTAKKSTTPKKRPS